MTRLAHFCSGMLALTAMVLLSFVSSSAEPPLVATTGPRIPAEEQKLFHLPPGFAIELVASEPDIIKPINLNFDDRGRLWVTQSVEYPFPAKGHKPRDTVKILESTRGDGKADKVTTFADGLNIPIGILPLSKGALVYSIPNIYRLSDPDGKDREQKREMLYTQFGSEDTHGMASNFIWGFDGWVYACHGFHNTSVVKGADGKKVVMQSGNTYRFKPDGSHIEQFTHGQVNPFGLCFDPLGNLYSADCHTRPVMMLLRGGYYDSFGKPHDGLGYAPEICPNYERSTAVAGIVYYAADHFPPEYRNTLFFGDVVTNEINQCHLEAHGSTLKAILQPKFLTCDDPWFRPVNIKLGLDGALYVADFYNRIIGHYEVPLTHPGRDHERGRIWRIVYRGKDGKGKPVQPRADWSKATVKELMSDLSHANLEVRIKAANQLVERGGQDAITSAQTVVARSTESTPYKRMHCLWVLERLHALTDKLLEAAAQDPESGVRVHAMRVLAERARLSDDQHKLALEALKDSDDFVQRAAAEVLGTHPSADNMPPLLLLRDAVPEDDTHLLYVVRMAMRNQLRPAETWAKLSTDCWCIAYKRAVADVATGVPTVHAASFLLTHLQEVQETPENLLRYVHHVARYGSDDTIKALLTFARSEHPADVRHQATLFKAIQQGTQERGGKLSADARQWGEGLAKDLLAAKDADSIQAGAELAGSQQMASMRGALVTLAQKKELPEAQRQATIDALMAINSKGHLDLLGLILSDASEPLPLREHVAQTLAATNQTQAHAELLKALAVAPAGLQNTIAGALAGSRQGAEKLVEAVAAGKASARLLQESAVHVQLDKYPKLKERVTTLTKGMQPADQRLQEIINKRRAGFAAAKADATAGVKVYEKNCGICHQLGGKGAKVGPQLDGIGVRGIDRLLEDIIDPNRNVDQAFRASTLTLKSGKFVSGLVLREEGEVVVLADNQGKEVRVPKNTIEERSVSQLSPMPANLVDQIPEADFYNLLAYLLSLRTPQGDKPGK